MISHDKSFNVAGCAIIGASIAGLFYLSPIYVITATIIGGVIGYKKIL